MNKTGGFGEEGHSVVKWKVEGGRWKVEVANRHLASARRLKETNEWLLPAEALDSSIDRSKVFY